MPIPLVARPNTAIPNTTIDASDFNEDLDTAFDAIEAITRAVNTATGSKASLNDRLSVAMNADGTLKTNVGGSEWIPGPAPTYVSGTSFTVAGDQTDLYSRNRQVRMDGSTVLGVKSSAYADGVTTVTTFTSGVPNPVSAVEHSIHADADVRTVHLAGCVGGQGMTILAGYLETLARIKVLVPTGKRLYLRRITAYSEDTDIRWKVDDWTSTASVVDEAAAEMILLENSGADTFYLVSLIAENTGADTTLEGYESWHLTLTVE